MWNRSIAKNPFADLKRLIEPEADGPVVGFYGNHPIAAAVVDQYGNRYIYVGAAPRRCNGLCDYEVLRSDEWIVEPGLVYTSDLEHRSQASSASLLRSPSRAIRELKEVLLRWL